MPPSKADEVLTEKFADYFLNKMKTIRDTLDGYEKYQPTDDGKTSEINGFHEGVNLTQYQQKFSDRYYLTS